MYKVVNIKFLHADTLEALINKLANDGWVPLFPVPVWHSEAIVFRYMPETFDHMWAPFPFVHGSTEAEANALSAFEQALMSPEELVEEERLREP